METRYGHNVKQDLANLVGKSVGDLNLGRLATRYSAAVSARRAQDRANQNEFVLNVPHLQYVRRNIAEELERNAEQINGNLPVASVFDAYCLVKARKDLNKDAGLRALYGHLEKMWKRNRGASITAKSYLTLHDHYKRNFPKSAAADVIVEIGQKGYATLPLGDLERIASMIRNQDDYDLLITKHGLNGSQPHQVKARRFILSLLNGEKGGSKFYGPFYGDPEGEDPDVLLRPFESILKPLGIELAENPDKPKEDVSSKKVDSKKPKKRNEAQSKSQYYNRTIEDLEEFLSIIGIEEVESDVYFKRNTPEETIHIGIIWTQSGYVGVEGCIHISDRSEDAAIQAADEMWTENRMNDVELMKQYEEDARDDLIRRDKEEPTQDEVWELAYTYMSENSDGRAFTVKMGEFIELIEKMASTDKGAAKILDAIGEIEDEDELVEDEEEDEEEPREARKLRNRKGAGPKKVFEGWDDDDPSMVWFDKGGELPKLDDDYEGDEEDMPEKEAQSKGFDENSRINSIILEGMARAFFVSSWANEWEELERKYMDFEGVEGRGIFPNFSGVDLMDIAPPTPQKATEFATEFYREIEKNNNISLENFLPPGETEDFDKELFGHYLAMEGMGHGVSWEDDHEKHGLKIPYTGGMESDLAFEDPELNTAATALSNEYDDEDEMPEKEAQRKNKRKNKELTGVLDAAYATDGEILYSVHYRPFAELAELTPWENLKDEDAAVGERFLDFPDEICREFTLLDINKNVLSTPEDYFALDWAEEEGDEVEPSEIRRGAKADLSEETSEHLYVNEEDRQDSQDFVDQKPNRPKRGPGQLGRGSAQMGDEAPTIVPGLAAHKRAEFREVKEEIERLGKFYQEQLGSEILDLVRKANSDLYSGPLYLDEEGEEVSYMDEGARPFDFSGALKKIKDAFGDLDIRNTYIDENGSSWRSENAWLDDQFEFDLENAKENPDEDFDEDKFRENWEPFGRLYEVDARDILEEIVGRELSTYL